MRPMIIDFQFKSSQGDISLKRCNRVCEDLSSFLRQSIVACGIFDILEWEAQEKSTAGQHTVIDIMYILIRGWSAPFLK